VEESADADEDDDDKKGTGEKRHRISGSGKLTTRITAGQRERLALTRKKPMRWITTRQGRHILQFFDGLLRLSPIDQSRELWQIGWVSNGKRKQLASHVPLEYAQGIAEDTARDRDKKLMQRNAKWLQQTPTPKQVAFAQRLGIDWREHRSRGALSEEITKVVGDW